MADIYRKELSNYRFVLFVTALANAFLFFLLFVSEKIQFRIFIALLQMLAGIFLIRYSWKKRLPVIFLLFIIEYLLLLPLTSFEYFEMPAMSVLQWKYCLIGECVMLAGLFLASFLKPKYKIGYYTIGKDETVFNIIIIFLGIFTYLYYYYVNGTGISQFQNSASPNISEPFPLFSFFVTLPELSILLLAKTGFLKKHKSLWVLILIYYFCQLLTGKRWQFTTGFLFLFSLVDIYKIKPKRILGLVVLLLVIFFFSTLVRSSDAVISLYRPYLNTAEKRYLYRFTSIFRYYGMSQRNMVLYLNRLNCGPYFARTIYFFTKFFGGKNNIADLIFVNGYNVTNMFGYCIIDFGNFWWLGLLFWSFAIGVFMNPCGNRNNTIMHSIFYGASFLSMIFSFYADITSFISYFIVFPIFFLIMHTIFVSLRHS